MNGHPLTGVMFLALLGVLGVAGIVAGCVLALSGYSSAGAFGIAAACVGVLGTLAAQRAVKNGRGEQQ